MKRSRLLTRFALGIPGIAAVLFVLWWGNQDRVSPSFENPPASATFVPSLLSNDDKGIQPSVQLPSQTNVGRADWPEAIPLGSIRRRLDDGLVERVTLLDPNDGLPFLVRLVETLRPDNADDEEGQVLHRREMVANHVLIQQDPDAGQMAGDSLRDFVTGLGAELRRHESVKGLSYVVLPEEMVREDLDAVPNLLALLERGRLRNGFAFAEPDYIVRASARPDDPFFSRLWGLAPETPLSGIDADIDAIEAWEVLTDAPEVLVAVIDSGIRTTHRDLSPNLWRNPGELPGNGRDDDGNGIVDDIHGMNAITNTGSPTDENGHGTHVAGTIGAAGNNGRGVTGVAWDVQLMGLKFLGRSGGGATSSAIRAIDYARRHGARVVNNSWGGAGFSRALLQAVERTLEADMLFVVAAGNDAADNDTEPSYPANYEVNNVISVASLTRLNTLSSFSNTGEERVHLGAPGSDIVSTWHTSDDAYQRLSGTSMAAPHVSGALALMAARFPDATALDLKNRLLAGTEPLGEAHSTTGLGGRVISGGRLNLERAITLTGSDALPLLSEGLEDRTAAEGASVTLSVVVEDSSEEVTFSWSRDGVILDGATGPSLDLREVGQSDAGLYRVAVGNAAGRVTSTARLEVRLSDQVLAEALGAPDLFVFSEGDALWQPDPLMDAGARSGRLDGNQRSWLRTILEGPGELRFEWAVSSEAGFDFLYWVVDGRVEERISGQQPWASRSLMLSEGTHEISWVYIKDPFVQEGRDAGFVRSLQFESEEEEEPSVFGFAHWIRAQLDTGGGDELILSPEADPDRDGFTNLEEFAFGMDPRQASSEGAPKTDLVIREDGLPALQLVYRQRVEA
ncbi:MAG: S8 family serine peptidase, partial [Verrucomicrobiota bacterium]